MSKMGNSPVDSAFSAASNTERVESYRILFENNPLAMWVFDTDTLEFLMVNNAAVELYGYTQEEFLCMSIKDIRSPEQVDQLLSMMEMPRNNLNQVGTWVHLKKDKSELYVNVASHVLPPENGRQRRMVVVNDISARILAERQLKEAETLAQSILSNIAETVFSLNGNMEMIYVSPQCHTTFGYTPEQLCTDKTLWFRIIHPEDRILFEQALPRIRTSTDQFQIECRMFTLSGEMRWAITRCTAQLDQNGRMVRMDGSINDITQRKLAEQRLRFADFSLERASESFLWTGPDAQILRVNKAICQLLGYSEREMLDLTLFHLAPVLQGKSWQDIWQRLQQQESITLETELQHKNGQLRPVEIHLNFFIYERESFSFISCREISERKQSEKERSQLIEETVRQNEHLQQFAYIVSHNLRAPVANIVGLTSLFNRRNPGDPINAALISKLEKTTLRLDTTIKDLNDILTIRSQTDQHLELVNLQQAYREVYDSLSPQLVTANARVFTDFGEGSTVLGRKGYVDSIFLNLISNAIKYRAPERGLEIHIKTLFSNGFLCLQVQDNGLGIDLEKQGQKVFGLYKRFHPHIEGKGVGLHMTKTQAEALGGKVEIESSVDVGTTFKIFFQAPAKK
ncbi:PAS domain S-box protein [Rufibacter sp. LB8]|uniref:PAS domain-containing sensor histidine kinase n=1 Tax=Rufibacter sp. LB8 TaxID=2777781 RepID=UPI00178C417D|nr:PAS domain S-box protein [Rufibacter sp. LB8]